MLEVICPGLWKLNRGSAILAVDLEAW